MPAIRASTERLANWVLCESVMSVRNGDQMRRSIYIMYGRVAARNIKKILWICDYICR